MENTKTKEYPGLIFVEPWLWREARISARVTTETFDAVERLRRAENISRSEVVCRALAAYLSDK